MNLSDAQLHTLRHMLGINTPYDRIPRPYRDHAAVVPGDPHYLELERLGAVVNHGFRPWTRYHLYTCTDEGKAAALASHRTIRHSRAKRRYAKFLDASEIDADLTFRAWLTSPEWAEHRSGA